MSAGVAEALRPTVKRILLVDDHEMYLKYVSREFVRAGVQISSAQTLDDAVELVRLHKPDVALVDLFLTPPESGLDVIRAIKDTDPNVFCILVSAHMSVAHAMMGVRAGADDVFIKPFNARQVIARVELGVFDEPQQTTPTLHDVEWEHISRVLHDHAGNITQAADSLGIFRQSLQRKIIKHAPRMLSEEPGAYPLAPPPPPEPEPEPAPKPKAQKAKLAAKAKPRKAKRPRKH
jgi:two-component system response regulator RegA